MPASGYNRRMEYRYTRYFENQVLRKRSYLKKEWCVRVIENPIRVEMRRATGFDSGAWLKNWVVRYFAW